MEEMTFLITMDLAFKILEKELLNTEEFSLFLSKMYEKYKVESVRILYQSKLDIYLDKRVNGVEGGQLNGDNKVTFKLGHHGSSTSSSYEFLETILPLLALISVGFNNSYHHPSNEVILNCKDLGINVLQTKDVGMIHIYSFHFLHCIQTANGIFSLINSI